MLTKRKDALARFMQAYRESIEWMYSDPAAIKTYAEFAKLPESQVASVRDYIPKTAIDPDRIAGMDELIANFSEAEFLPAPLSAQQVKDMVQFLPPR